MGLFSRKVRVPELVFYNGRWQSCAAVLANNWYFLASEAWKGYLFYGRGFIRRGFIRLSEDPNPHYIPAAMRAIANSRAREDRAILEQCSRYQPKREVVVVAFFAESEKDALAGKTTFSAYVVRPPSHKKSTPPEAYESYRSILAMAAEQKDRREMAADAESV